MIEIEKKFIVTAEQREMLIKDAEFLGEKIFTDVYWDDEKYSLTTQDVWIRQREGDFELKIPMNVDIEERVSDQYRELEDQKEIREYLKLPDDSLLEDALKDLGYGPFVKITTTRQKYKKDGFSFDFDSMDFGYDVMEIEYMTNDESRVIEATQQIVDYAKKYHLSDEVARGKVVEYLRRNNPEHFKALIDAKVIK